VRWTEGDDLPEPALAVAAIALADGDQPPITLPTRMGSVASTTWQEWAGRALSPDRVEDWAVRHFLVLYARSRALCCVVSPGFPLRGELRRIRGA
jgi:hypothetical protein